MTDTTPAPEGVTPEQVAAMCRTMRERPYRLGGETEDQASLRRIKERDDAATMIEALAADLAAQKARAEKLGRELNIARYGQPDFSWSVHKEAMGDLEAALAAAEARADAAEAERDKLRREGNPADHALVDKYRNYQTHKAGVFNFPGDVAAIIRRLEAAEAKVARLVEMLLRFLPDYEPWMDEWPDDAVASTYKRHTYGDHRAARAVIAEVQG